MNITSKYNDGERIRELLREKNMTQRELAKKSNLCVENISRIINKNQGVRLSTLNAILRALEVSAKEFFNPLSADEKAKMLIDAFPANEETKENLRSFPPDKLILLFDKRSWPHLRVMLELKDEGYSLEDIESAINTATFYKELFCNNCKFRKGKPI